MLEEEINSRLDEIINNRLDDFVEEAASLGLHGKCSTKCLTHHNQVSWVDELVGGHLPDGFQDWMAFRGCLSMQFLTLLKLFPNVRSLDIGKDDNLSILNVGGCPHGGGRLANLTSLSIRGCKNLKAFPEAMCDLFPSLETIHLIECPEIESIFEASLLPKLWYLEIWECEKLTSFQSDWGLQRLPSFKSLNIRGVRNEHVESFPNEGLLPSTLTALVIWDFQNLKNLNWRGIRQLSSLESLLITDCPRLESLPDEGLPPSLSTLQIYKCPLLAPCCKRDSGDYWPKKINLCLYEEA